MQRQTNYVQGTKVYWKRPTRHHNPPNVDMSLFHNDSDDDDDDHEQEGDRQRAEQCSIETWTSAEEVTLWTIKLLQAVCGAPGFHSK